MKLGSELQVFQTSLIAMAYKYFITPPFAVQVSSTFAFQHMCLVFLQHQIHSVQHFVCSPCARFSPRLAVVQVQVHIKVLCGSE